ncbi:MAG: hypothetical protein ABIP30_12100 [Ferruginibacter sp.]
MNKYFLAFFSILIFASCQNKNTQQTVVNDTAQTTADNSLSNKEAVPIPTISAQELQDDSVFTDGSVATSWENAGFTDIKGFKLFLKQMQLWVMDNNKQQLADAVQYPLKNIKTPEQMVTAYDSVFTKEVKLSFAMLHFNQIFRNQQGAMIGDGKVWFRQDGKQFKIVAINN